MPRASLNLHWHAWSRFETRLPSIQPSLQSLRIFRSRPRVSSINFKAALDATCNTFSGALTDAWPLFPPWSARGTNPFNKPLPFDVSTNKKPGWKSSWSIELPVSRARSQVISSFLLSFFVCNWIGCCEQLFDDPSGESFTVETGVVSFLQGILFFSNWEKSLKSVSKSQTHLETFSHF